MNIKLNSFGSKRILGGHPWVRRKDQLHFKALPPPGEWVRLQDDRSNFLGHAFSEGATGEVAFRVISRDRKPALDEAWFKSLVQSTLAKRRSLLSKPQAAFRLINGENDGLPGLFCDKFGPYAVLDVLSPGAMAFVGWVEKVLVSELALKGLFRKIRFKDSTRVSDKSTVSIESIYGELPKERFWAEVDGLKYWIKLEAGAHEGLFLDQRLNRSLVAEQARGREVLNSFCYTGAFSVACLKAGAVKTTQLDLSKTALDWARENLSLNGLDPETQEWRQEEAFDKMKAWHKKGRTFDLIIQDPPPFSRSRHGVFQASRDYARLASLSMQLAAPGAILAFGCGVQDMAKSTFERQLKEAAEATSAVCRVLSWGRQPEDFPVLPGFPEGDYHKFALLKVEAKGGRGALLS
jgi:23S rRNA (cytosine1962-C5)-methyltransferase